MVFSMKIELQKIRPLTDYWHSSIKWNLLWYTSRKWSKFLWGCKVLQTKYINKFCEFSCHLTSFLPFLYSISL